MARSDSGTNYSRTTTNYNLLAAETLVASLENGAAATRPVLVGHLAVDSLNCITLFCTTTALFALYQYTPVCDRLQTKRSARERERESIADLTANSGVISCPKEPLPLAGRWLAAISILQPYYVLIILLGSAFNISSRPNLPTATPRQSPRPNEIYHRKMILLEGMLSAPPERSTIIGRAVWKVGLLVTTALRDVCTDI